MFIAIYQVDDTKSCLARLPKIKQDSLCTKELSKLLVVYGNRIWYDKLIYLCEYRIYTVLFRP